MAQSKFSLRKKNLYIERIVGAAHADLPERATRFSLAARFIGYMSGPQSLTYFALPEVVCDKSFDSWMALAEAQHFKVYKLLPNQQKPKRANEPINHGQAATWFQVLMPHQLCTVSFSDLSLSLRTCRRQDAFSTAFA